MLYIMRHGQTDWNVKYKIQGRTDIPLNEEGRAMAVAAREEYADINFDICYSSPLIRARETAELVLSGRDVPIITDDRLMEMSFGIYEGYEKCFQTPDCPVNIIFKAPEQYTTKFEGAESFEELFARTGDFIKEIVNPGLAEGKDILIVGHGAMNLSIVCQIKGIPIENFWSTEIKNCKLMRLI
jgi:probable phosphoglycerate mutase